MNDEVPNIVRFWKENNEQSFYGWQRIHEKTQELMPLMEQHVAVQLQHAESEQSESVDCKTIQRERMKEYLTVRKFPEDINRESSLELISYQAAWASGELAKRIEVDLRAKFIPAFGADERCMICNLSMEWNFYGSVLRTSQDLQEKNGEAGFPFSVQVAEENSEMLRRLSAEKYISIHDWTRFLIADKRGIVEAVRLNRWIELKTGNKPPFDGPVFSGPHKRSKWWKAFYEAGHGAKDWCSERMKNEWQPAGVVNVDKMAPDKGEISFKLSFLREMNVREPGKTVVHQSNAVTK